MLYSINRLRYPKYNLSIKEQGTSQTIMSSYSLFDVNGNLINPKDLQNRAVWYEHGVSKEEKFVKLYHERLDVIVNPGKETNPTLPDLLYKGNLSDLKSQETPLFIAGKYGVDPTYAVTFNLKDALDYGHFGKDYPKFTIFYWVQWIAVKMEMYGKFYVAKPLKGVWRVDFSRLEALRIKAPIHWYNQREKHTEQNPQQREILSQFEPRLRQGDVVWAIRGLSDNAACSYIFDLRTFEKVD
jgi:hypothetical protein